MEGAWSGYVEEHLIPRLNGFELLMNVIDNSAEEKM